jgi:O-antigen/teichoic acid export membrane protein
MSSIRRALASVGLLAAANAVNAVLAFAVSVVAARSLEPAQFGRIAVLMATSATLAIGLDLGVNQILVRRVAVRPASRLVPDVLRVRLYVAVAASAATGLAVLAQALRAPGGLWGDLSLWALLTASAAWQLVFSTEQAHVQGAQRFGTLAVQIVAVGVVRLVLVLAAALTWASFRGVLLAYALPPVLAGSWTVVRFRGVLLRAGRWRMLRSLVPVIGLAGVTVAITAFLPRIGLWAVAMLADDAQAAAYAVAFQAASLVLTLGAAITLCIVPHVARLDSEGRARGFLVAYLRASVPIMVIMAGGALLFSRLVPHVFGRRYAGTEMITFWLVLSFVVSLVNSPFYALQQSRFRYGRLVAIHAVQVGILLLGSVLLIPRFGAPGAALADLLARVVAVTWITGVALAETRGEISRAHAGVEPPDKVRGASDAV